jgi:hypothetical protein
MDCILLELYTNKFGGTELKKNFMGGGGADTVFSCALLCCASVAVMWTFPALT